MINISKILAKIKIQYKTQEQIELLRKSNIFVGKTHAEIAKIIKPGIKTIELDKLAKEYILDNKGIPSFLNYNGFPNTLCISINDVVVHGIPSEYEIQEGDLVSIDCGIELNGYHGDSAFSYAIGKISPEKWKLMKVTKESLFLGIEQAVNGSRIGSIGNAIEQHAKKNGFSIVRNLTGHGVGQNLHEKPEVPNYGKRGRGKRINKGLTIAIEPMINMGVRDVNIDPKDEWTVRTNDGKPSAHYEHSIAVMNGKADILSTFEFIEKAIEKNDYISSP